MLNWFLFLGPPDHKLAVKKHKTFLAPKDCTCDFTYYVIFLFICHYCMIITTYLNTAIYFSLFHVVRDDILRRYFALILQCFEMKIYYVHIFFNLKMEKKKYILDQWEVCLLFQLRKIYYHNKFSSQNFVKSSQNNFQKYHPGWHEKDFRVCKKHYVEKKKVVHPIYVLSYSISSRYSKRDDYYFISINYGTYYSSDFLWRSLYYWSTLM